MKRYFVFLGILQVFVAIGAIPAGLGYLADLSGSGMGTSPALLENSPFQNFLIPALFLLLVHGIGNAIAAFFSFKKKEIAGKLGFSLGVILCLWILLQVYWIGLSSFMQPLFFIIGFIEMVLGILIIKRK